MESEYNKNINTLVGFKNNNKIVSKDENKPKYEGKSYYGEVLYSFGTTERSELMYSLTDEIGGREGFLASRALDWLMEHDIEMYGYIIHDYVENMGEIVDQEFVNRLVSIYYKIKEVEKVKESVRDLNMLIEESLKNTIAKEMKTNHLKLIK